MEAINQVLNDYRTSLQSIENSDLTKVSNLKKGIDLSAQTIFQLRLMSRASNCFQTQEDEICFFKYIKPFVSGRLKFYGELQKFQLKWPKADVKNQKKYIRAAIKKLEGHKIKNLAFWRYVKNKQTQKDSFYFLRCHHHVGITCDMSQFVIDPEFSTSYDNLMAQFVASDLLMKHYKKQLLKLTTKNPDPPTDPILNTNRSWSGSKTDLIELIYAFHSSGVINNGQVKISKMIKVSEKFFNIKLGNPYKTFAEIKARENDQTKFLDSLKQALLTKINLDDSKFK